MISKDRKAEIARENGAKSQGPTSDEGKEKCARNAITHGERAQALKLIVPPHSACLANEDRQAFYKLYDNLIAKYRPADETEQMVVKEIPTDPPLTPNPFTIFQNLYFPINQHFTNNDTRITR